MLKFLIISAIITSNVAFAYEAWIGNNIKLDYDLCENLTKENKKLEKVIAKELDEKLKTEFESKTISEIQAIASEVATKHGCDVKLEINLYEKQ